MICPQCQNELKEGAKFCGSCGAPAPEIKPHFCGRCGSKITDTPDKVCAACRAKEAQSSTPVAPAPVAPTPVPPAPVAPTAATPPPAAPAATVAPPAPAPQKKKGGLALPIALLVIAVLIGSGGYYLFGMGGLEQIQTMIMLSQKDDPASEEVSGDQSVAEVSSTSEDSASIASSSSAPASSAPASSAPASSQSASSSPAPAVYEQKDWGIEIAALRERYKPVSVRFIPVPQAEELSDFENGVARIKVNGEWGLLTNPEEGWSTMGYQQIMPFSEEMAAVQSLDGKWGYIHVALDGAKDIPCIWDAAGSFKDGYAVVSLDKQYGLIDTFGTVVIQPSFEDMRSYGEGMVPVKDNGKWGYVDAQDRLKLPFVYEDAGPFVSGVAVVVQNGKAFYIDTAGNKVTGEFDDAWTFNENHTAKVKVGDRYGLIDTKGNYLVRPEWDNVWNLQEGVATVQRSGKYGYVNQQGATAIEPMYSDVWSSSFGLIPVKLPSGQWGYVDQQGNKAIQQEFSQAYNFSEGVGRVGQNGKYALIDLNGNALTQYSYKVMGYVREGYCPVMTTDNQWGYLQITY